MTTHDASDARCHVYGRRAARFAPHTRERDYPPHPTHARASAARRVDDASTMRRPRRPRDVATSRPRSIDRIASTPRARLSTALARAFDDRSNANPSIVYPRSAPDPPSGGRPAAAPVAHGTIVRHTRSGQESSYWARANPYVPKP